MNRFSFKKWKHNISLSYLLRDDRIEVILADNFWHHTRLTEDQPTAITQNGQK